MQTLSVAIIMIAAGDVAADLSVHHTPDAVGYNSLL